MNFKRLDELTEEGYLRKVISPCGRLMLYNYTLKTVYERYWNKYTLNARGTVYEVSTGKIVAKAFPKFFNFMELPASKARNILNQTEFNVFKKEDGSLGVLYFYDDSWRLNTRGSFTSDQAKHGTILLDKYDLSNVDKNATLLVEIIYPENRIIVDYGDEEKLVLIGAYDTVTGQEISIYSVDCNLPKAEEMTFNTIDDIISLQGMMSSLEEGFVVRLKDGYRVKFKSLAYLEVARALQNMTPKVFWKSMVDLAVPDDLIMAIPEEFRKEAEEIRDDLHSEVKYIQDEIQEDKLYVISEIGNLENTTEYRKKLGLLDDVKHKTAIFNMIYNRSNNDYIHKMIEPRNSS